MKLKKFELALLFGLCLAFFVGFTCVREQQALASKMIRLHVIANSDTDIDQALKLKVRDSVIEKVGRLLDGENNIEMAAALINESLPDIEDAAERTLRSNGCIYSVRAELGEEEYMTREYDDFTLPAGLYNSLRVTIGEGEGKNWWCVVFPPLCFTAAADFEKTAEAAGLTTSEIQMISEQDGEVVFKFQILEWIQKIFAQLHGEK